MGLGGHAQWLRESSGEEGVGRGGRTVAVEEVVGVFFPKNQFNLAKGLKAAQVHNSDTPSRSHRDWWGGGSIS